MNLLIAYNANLAKKMDISEKESCNMQDLHIVFPWVATLLFFGIMWWSTANISNLVLDCQEYLVVGGNCFTLSTPSIWYYVLGLLELVFLSLTLQWSPRKKFSLLNLNNCTILSEKKLGSCMVWRLIFKGHGTHLACECSLCFLQDEHLQATPL